MSLMRVLFETLVKAALFIGLDLFLRRFLGPAASNLCAVAGFGLCEVVRHAGIDCVVNFLAKNRREIGEFLVGIAVFTLAIWAGILLLWLQLPYLAWPLMFFGEAAILAWMFEKKREDIIGFSFGIPMVTAPLWVGGLLLWHQHPFIAWPLIFVGEPAMLVWVANLPDPKKGSKPPSTGGPAGPPDAGTPGAVAPA
ncbi:hypothetical protein CWO89_31720 [Bradyrhizobium sp. Leo170]|nr:hypothetical protein CWO89_31720 [Bradyrhizobium sp. Leo170]